MDCKESDVLADQKCFLSTAKKTEKKRTTPTKVSIFMKVLFAFDVTTYKLNPFKTIELRSFFLHNFEKM